MLNDRQAVIFNQDDLPSLELDDLVRLKPNSVFTKSSSCFPARATTGPSVLEPSTWSPSSTCIVGEETRNPPRRRRRPIKPATAVVLGPLHSEAG
jgi:hypothetical protein